MKCHGAEGTGDPARGRLPQIPNFTDAAWQARRSDAQVRASILKGKGNKMPAFREKVSEEEARVLAAYIREFAPTTKKPGQAMQKPLSSGNFEERQHRLQDELDELRREFRRLSKDSADGQPSKPPETLPRDAPSKPRRGAAPRPSAPAATGTPAAHVLFRQHCVKCHGEDGTGGPARARLPQIPNFAEAAWQARQSDAQLRASILDGKGKKMPPFREKISEEEARGLAAYVRAFAPGTERQGPKEQKEPTEGDAGKDAQPPMGFAEKLIGWLGGFHPAAVHFPIALLTAAALAELLRLATGKPAFDAASRYCLRLGALTAVAVGVLGWFAGGFRLSDASWSIMTHRWLGTSTVTGAGLVLVLSEVGRHPHRHRTRLWFRVVLLVLAVVVLATGFFGGAVVFGLDHYAWPQ